MNVSLSHHVRGDPSDQPAGTSTAGRTRGKKPQGQRHGCFCQRQTPCGHPEPRGGRFREGPRGALSALGLPQTSVSPPGHTPPEALGEGGGHGPKLQGSRSVLQPEVVGIVCTPVTDGETDTQRGRVPWPRSHSEGSRGSGLRPQAGPCCLCRRLILPTARPVSFPSGERL